MRFYVNLLSITLLFLTACGREESLDYAFIINKVTVSRAYQALNVHIRQNLQLSQQAREALEHGVTLTIRLDFELHNDNNMSVMPRMARHFKLRYLPLSERYQLSVTGSDELRVFSRLRHSLAAMDNIDVKLHTGPLPPGSYEIRTRVSLDKTRLPTPMQLPVRFSSQWQHDSEWSTWPFEISV